MNEKGDAEYDKARSKQLWDRAGRELKAYEGKNLLEKYGLYMLRVQMYEISLKHDLSQLFQVAEDLADRMNLNSILRYYVDHDIRAHPILYTNLSQIARQRNMMAHEFLANANAMSSIAGGAALQLFQNDLDKWAMELELAFQEYLMLKETDMLYKDYGVEPTYPYPKCDSNGADK